MKAAEGFELGSGGGRIARYVAPHVRLLHCIEPSPNGMAAARRAMRRLDNVEFHRASVDAMPLAEGTQDFGYSLGVLHHVPDTEAGLKSCVARLKPGAPFLLYVYYAFDNRPEWFRYLWRASDVARRGISALPFGFRRAFSTFIAVTAYWPLSRIARLLERKGAAIDDFPLSYYRNSSWETLRANALDRFGTSLERRFSRVEVEAMMVRAGLRDVKFRDGAPYWVAIGWKAEPA
jgi:SAM-dependent methyltransferase